MGSAAEVIGEKLYVARATYMVDTQQGLTSAYNRLKDTSCTDPRIVELRRLHEEMDRAVLDAYGWTDVQVPPYCPTIDAEMKAVAAFEDEVIDRLFALNAERAKEEETLGLGRKKGKTKSAQGKEPDGASPKNKAGRKKTEPAGQGELF